jgi:LacI family transcriptional regulator
MRRNQEVTTRHIAEQLRLSVSTVGRALARDPRISHATRLRVEAKAAELGYVGNQAARLMRGARSTVVGLVVPDVRNSFYSAAAHALAQCMGQQGYQVMLSETADERDAELAHVRDLVAAHVAGVVVVPTPNPHPETARLLRNVPHAQFLRRRAAFGDNWFGINDREVIRAATSHVFGLGHRRIAYLGGQAGSNAPSTSKERLAGFLDVLGELAEQPLIAHALPGSAANARDALAGLLSAGNPPTALVTASVKITEGVLQELSARRVSVPGALSVVGFGDEPSFGWWGPGLTTMSLPVHEVATACAMWLLQQFGQAGTPAPYSSAAAGYLVERGSTAPPAAPAGSRPLARKASHVG